MLRGRFLSLPPTLRMHTRPLSTASEVLRLIRPKQWIKNAFVFAPLIFARLLFDAEPFMLALRAFVTFCLTASAVYIINDVADRDADRAHPEKRHRPLAAGTVSLGHAFVFLGILLTADVALLVTLPLKFAVILGTYFTINLAYSFRLRNVFLLDVFIIAAGFMLRVLGGAYAINVTLSSWIVLCSLFISLFLGFAKRRGELVEAQQAGIAAKRKVLQLYRVEYLDQVLTVTAAGTVISYALYTVAQRTVEMFGTDRLIYTTVFVIYGVFRYLFLIHTSSSVQNPTAAVTTDVPILVNGILWIAVCVGIIYFGGSIPGLSG
jgi:decaprenyl-phosphate phosphoribosyltransferase